MSSSSPASLYQFGSVLGVGTYGEVRSCVRLSDCVRYAAKLVDFSRFSEATRVLLQREIEILRLIDHEHCISIHEIHENVPMSGQYCDQCACTRFHCRAGESASSPLVCCLSCGHSAANHSEEQTRRLHIIVQELAIGGELFGLISHTGPLDESLARYYFRQLITGVGYLHKQGIYHRDLKLENLVLDSNLNLRIIDFGLAACRAPRSRSLALDEAASALSMEAIDASDEQTETEEFDDYDGWVAEEPTLHTGVGCVGPDTLIRVVVGSLVAARRACDLAVSDRLIDTTGKTQSILAIDKGYSKYMYRVSSGDPSFTPYLATYLHELLLAYRPERIVVEQQQIQIGSQTLGRFHYLGHRGQLCVLELVAEAGECWSALVDRACSLLDERAKAGEIVAVGAVSKIRVTAFMQLSEAARGALYLVKLGSCFSHSPVRISRVHHSLGLQPHYGIHVDNEQHAYALADGQLTGNSLPYSSPEVYYRDVYHQQPYKGSCADIWSCGVILFILLHAKPPFLRSLLKSYGTQYKRDKHFIAFMRGEGLIAHTSPAARDLIVRMMRLDPAERLDIEEIRRHEFFTGPCPDDEQAQKIMEQRAMQAWKAAGNEEMLGLMRGNIEQQRDANMRYSAVRLSAAIPIPANKDREREREKDKRQTSDLDIDDSFSSAHPTRPLFSLVNPASLPASFLVSPSYSLKGSMGGEEFIEQHERARLAESSGLAMQQHQISEDDDSIKPANSSPLILAMSGRLAAMELAGLKPLEDKQTE